MRRTRLTTLLGGVLMAAFLLPTVVELKVQVLALRGNGTVLRRSRIVSIAIPQPSASPSGDLTGESPTPVPPPSVAPDPSLPPVP